MNNLITLLNKENKTDQEIDNCVNKLFELLQSNDYESIEFIHKNLDESRLYEYNGITKSLYNTYMLQDENGIVFRFMPFVIPIIVNNQEPVDRVINLDYVVTLFRKNNVITNEEGVILLPTLLSFADIQSYNFITEYKINSALVNSLSNNNMDSFQEQIEVMFPPTNTNATLQFKFIMGVLINDVNSNSILADCLLNELINDSMMPLYSDLNSMVFNIPVDHYIWDAPILMSNAVTESYYFYQKATIPILVGSNPKITTMQLLKDSDQMIIGIQIGDTIIDNILDQEDFEEFVNELVEDTNAIKKQFKHPLIKLIS